MMKYYKGLNVKTPSRGTTGSAGIDFYVPENTPEFIRLLKEKNKSIKIKNNTIIMKPHERINIPSGIFMNIPKNHALIAFNKSGISLKYGLDTGACVVDEDYQGMIHLSLTNTTNKKIKIECGQKIVQFVLLPIKYETLKECSNQNDVFNEPSVRGTGAFGSTGIK